METTFLVSPRRSISSLLTFPPGWGAAREVVGWLVGLLFTANRWSSSSTVPYPAANLHGAFDCPRVRRRSTGKLVLIDVLLRLVHY